MQRGTIGSVPGACKASRGFGFCPVSDWLSQSHHERKRLQQRKDTCCELHCKILQVQALHCLSLRLYICCRRPLPAKLPKKRPLAYRNYGRSSAVPWALMCSGHLPTKETQEKQAYFVEGPVCVVVKADGRSCEAEEVLDESWIDQMEQWLGR